MHTGGKKSQVLTSKWPAPRSLRVRAALEQAETKLSVGVFWLRPLLLSEVRVQLSMGFAGWRRVSSQLCWEDVEGVGR